MSKKTDKTAEDKNEKTQEKSAPANRRVLLFGRMENDVCLPVVKRILRLNDQDPQTPIDLLINSSGGNGYNADAVIAIMNQVSAPVNTICLGHALSGACEILASGTGKRSAYEFSTLMFHQTLWEADGDITNLEIQAKQGQKFREAQIELLHRCTGRDKKQLRSDIERDHYLSAREALEYGLIDEIIYHCPQSKSAQKGKDKITALPGATSGAGSITMGAEAPASRSDTGAVSTGSRGKSVSVSGKPAAARKRK
jgi:ATP-dependent Clp protease, protease subunit